MLDPNKLSEDGSVASNIYAVSENEELLVVGLSNNGSDCVNINVIEVVDKSIDLDSLSRVSFLSVNHSMSRNLKGINRQIN